MDKKCKVLCLGDSNTYGYDPCSTPGARYPETVRWTGLLAQEGWEVLNRGQNGLTIPWGEKQILCYRNLVESLLPVGLITVMLGTNDLLMTPEATAEWATQRMEVFLTALLQTAPGVPLLLIAPPPMKTGDWVREERLLTESARLGGCYRALAQNLKIGFCDAGEWNAELTYDGVHLSADGHRSFARGLEEHVSHFL